MELCSLLFFYARRFQLQLCQKFGDCKIFNGRLWCGDDVDGERLDEIRLENVIG